MPRNQKGDAIASAFSDSIPVDGGAAVRSKESAKKGDAIRSLSIKRITSPFHPRFFFREHESSMKRKVFNFLPAMSFLLFMTTCVLWVRSYHTSNLLTLSAYRVHEVAITRGGVLLQSAGVTHQEGVWATMPTTFPAYDQLTELRKVTVSYIERYDNITARATLRWRLLTLPTDHPAWRPLLFNPRKDSNRFRSWPRLDAVSRVMSETESQGEDGRGGTYMADWLHGVRLWIPFWLLASLAAVLPILWMKAIWSDRRFGRVHLGLCSRCGYDLRASKDRCPECGTTCGAT